jgi:hypothetical protein
MNEKSKGASWAWIVFGSFLISAGVSLLIFFIWFFYQEEISISEIIKDIQNLRFSPGYYILAIVAGFIFFLSLLASLTEESRKAKILLDYRGVPGVIRIGKFEIKIENDLMLFKKKGFLRSRSWKEQKSGFKGVRLSAVYDWVGGEEEGVECISYFVQLLHPKKLKTLILCKIFLMSPLKAFNLIRKTWKETARALGLPAIEDSPLRSIQRGVQDLDKPIRALAKRNKISFDLKIDSRLPSHTKLLQKEEELTIIWREGLLSKSEIIISPTLMKIGRIIIPLDEIQYIGPLRHPKSGENTLVVASDSETFFMNGLSHDQGFWLGRLILAGACGKPNIFRIKYKSTVE